MGKGRGPQTRGLLAGLLCVAAAIAAGTQAALSAPPAVAAADLAALEVDTAARGCDPIDAANCLLPFPSNHFTQEVAPDEIGGVERGGTGRRVDLAPLAMPRNVVGKPIDPSEWNRNDGFSPGQMIMTFVPGVAVERDEDGEPLGPVHNAVPIYDLAQYRDPDTSVVVIDADTGERHPIWVEVDLNAGYLFPPGGEEKPGDAKPALMIRPAENFREGRRYVVALRSLEDEEGEPIAAGAFFASCRDGEDLPSPALSERCKQLRAEAFPVLEGAGIAVRGNDALHSAWDFTVASTENNVSRLRHMRDDAFANELGQREDADGRITDLGRAPEFEVTRTRDGGDFREIRGSIVVPSYVLPADPSPLETSSALEEIIALLEEEMPDVAAGLDLASTVSLPPNRLFFDPTDEVHPTDPAMQRYGDGLPDRTGEMEIPWVCRLPNDAAADDPARAGIHGHGLLGRRFQFPSDMMREHNHMFCNADWFGFATGDLANVATVLVDGSFFPVIPDATQQGMLNKLFVLRLIHHPDGLVTHSAFHDDEGKPRFDNGEVFYYGGSQGGILGGPVVALSKDVTRGGLRVPGMNYSLLLRRSTDFSPFSIPLYLSYRDDLDRSLVISLIQMLWDRAENNGYAAHIADNEALNGPDNAVLLGAAFADHQVTHLSAEVMARTIGVDLADFHPRSPVECGGDVRFCFETREEFQASGRNPSKDLLPGLPLSDIEDFPSDREEASYDDPARMGAGPGPPAGRRGAGPPDRAPALRSALVMWDEGMTATPPVGNIPADHMDDFDPHRYLPGRSASYRCMQSHFLHPRGGLVNVRDVLSPADCPAFPEGSRDARGKGRGHSDQG